MPIQKSVELASGVTVSYHRVKSGEFYIANNVVRFTVDRCVDSDHEPVETLHYETANILSQVAPQPSDGATVSNVIEHLLEQYLLSLPEYEGGTQVQ